MKKMFGKTNLSWKKLIIEDKRGNKTIFSLNTKRDSFDIEKE